VPQPGAIGHPGCGLDRHSALDDDPGLGYSRIMVDPKNASIGLLLGLLSLLLIGAGGA
jgi:hypothetical protein